MKKKFKLKVISIFILSLFLSSLVVNANIIDKKSAIKAVEEIRKNTVSNFLAIKRIEKDLKKAKFNFENFVQYAKLADTLKYHTAYILKISKETSRIKSENPLLIDVLEIIKVPNLSISKFEEVLFLAIKANTDEEKQKIIKIIEEIVK